MGKERKVVTLFLPTYKEEYCECCNEWELHERKQDLTCLKCGAVNQDTLDYSAAMKGGR